MHYFFFYNFSPFLLGTLGRLFFISGELHVVTIRHVAIGDIVHRTYSHVPSRANLHVVSSRPAITGDDLFNLIVTQTFLAVLDTTSISILRELLKKLLHNFVDG